MKRYSDIDPMESQINISKPLVNTIGKTEQNLEKQLMESIIDEKMKLKNTSFMDMLGTLTDVTYYHIVETNSSTNHMVDTNPIPDLTINTKKFEKIKNFQIKMNSALNIENESDDNTKSYITSGSCFVLPRTIKPYEGDMFVMEYYKKVYTYRINSVELKSMETDSGFECQFSLFKEDFNISNDDISQELEFRNELVGTSYRPILSTTEYSELQSIRELYTHIGKIFNSLFYDRSMNTYFLTGFTHREFSITDYFQQENNNNIGVHNDNMIRHVTSNDFVSVSGMPTCMVQEPTYYDNFLNYFIKENRIFSESFGTMVRSDYILPFDNKTYRKTIFNAIETKNKGQLLNTFLNPVNIQFSSPGVSPVLVGKYNVLHLGGVLDESTNLISPNLMKYLKFSDKYDLETPFNKTAYGSITAILVDTIVRYLLNKTDDLIERFIYLNDHKNELFEHVVMMNDIYYLYPIIGYIIESALSDKFKDNILL